MLLVILGTQFAPGRSMGSPQLDMVIVGAGPTGLDHTARELASLPRDLGRPLETHFIGHRLSKHDPRMIDAISTDIFHRYGLHDSNETGLFLIRPDGYIAFQSPGLSVREVKKFLAQFTLQKLSSKTAA